MPRLTRRQLLKTGLLASAGAAADKLIADEITAATQEEAP